MKRKKILIDARELTIRPTGTRMFLKHLITGLCGSERYELIIAVNQNCSAKSVFGEHILSNLRIIENYEYSGIVYDHLTLRKIAEREKVDVYYSPYPKLPILSNRILRVSSILDITYLKKNISAVGPLKKFLYKKFLLKMYAAHSDVIITLSEHSLKEISALLQISGDKIRIVQPSVDEIFRPQSSERITEIKNKYRLHPDGSYILYVGNLLPHKNVRALISAYRILPVEIRKKYPLILVVSGDMPIEYRRISPSDNIHIILNQVPFEDLPALYSGASVFVFPSLSEGFGLPPLEAMACGCPVASSGISSMPEVLGENSALYFDPLSPESIARAITEVLADENLRQKLTDRGFERAKIFTPRRTFEMFEKILDEVPGRENG